MELYNTNSDYSFPSTSGKGVKSRRLPPVPSLPSLRVSSSSSSSSSSSLSPPSSTFSPTPSSAGSSSPASSPGSASPESSPSKNLPRVRPLPQIPASRHVSSPGTSQSRLDPNTQLVVCRSCLNCVTTSESLLPISSVPPGTRAFRGFSGKASLFTDVYNISMSKARVQLMTTGAHTLQETFCANCSLCLGWKIIKAHERTERWKEGKWLLELENLWLLRNQDILSSSFGKAMGWGAEPKRGILKEHRGQNSDPGTAFEAYPKDAAKIVETMKKNGMGLESVGSKAKAGTGTHQVYPQAGSRHQHSRSTPNFGRIGGYQGSGSAVHLPLPCAS